MSRGRGKNKKTTAPTTIKDHFCVQENKNEMGDQGDNLYTEDLQTEKLMDGVQSQATGINASTTSQSDAAQVPVNVSFDLQALLRTVIQETIASVTQNRSIPTTQNVSHVSESAVAQLIPDFNPKKGSLQTMDDWLTKVDQYAEVYGWSEKATICHALPKLKGIAKTWYDSMATVQRTWNQWKLLLRETFPSTVGLQRLYQEMIDRKRRPHETVEEYFHEKMALVRACHLEDSNAVEFVINGLGDPSIIQAVSVRDFTSLTELLKCLKRLEDNAALSVQANASKPNYPPSQRQGNSDAKQHHQRKRPVKNEAGESLCFNCNNYGHLSINCSKPQRRIRCYKCNRVGHLSAACPQPAPDGKTRTAVPASQGTLAVPPSMYMSASKTEGNLKYFQDVCLDGKDVRAYVDLGSGCVTLREEDARRLDIKFEKPERTCSIGGYGNAKVYPIGITECKLTVDQATAHVTVYIVPDEAQTIPLIVGQPFTDKPSITVIKRNNFIRFFEENGEQPDNGGILDGMNIPSLPRKSVSLWAKEATVIPPKYVGFIGVYTGVSGHVGNELFVDRRNCNQEGREHCVPRCVITLGTDGTSIVPIMNTSSRDIIINQDEHLVRAEPCVPEGEEDMMVGTQLLSTLEDELPLNDIHVGEQLNGDQRLELLELLQSYRDCFALNMHELGLAKNVHMSLELTTNTPVTYRPYRLSYSERERVNDMVTELKSCGVVEDSSSPYASPVLVVKKKTGESRLCVDYRELNRITKKDRFPLPLIDDQLERLQGQKYFTSLDMASGYHQIEMAESSKQFTAFVTPDGHFQFTRMPFGLANAPAVFQRAINAALGPLRYSVALAYMDDVLIPSTSFREGLDHLEQILRVLRSAGLRLKLTKCRFLLQKIEFLGYEISSEGIRPGDYKITSVREFKCPTSVHKVRRFLGLGSYFRRFVQNFAIHARPLTALLCKGVEFQWGEAQDAAFQYLRMKLTERPVLAAYDPKHYTELHTDASSEGLGAILMQQQEDSMHPVCYASRQTTSDESRYHSYELETLAIVWGVEKFRPYLLGRDFTIMTDCNSVRDAFSKRDMVPRIGRWWLRLQEFTFKIEHRPGSRMCHVDALSRAPWGEPEEMDVTDGQTILFNTVEHDDDWLLMAQLTDPKIKAIRDEFSGNLDQKNENLKNYTLKEGRLYRKVQVVDGESLRWVVPDRVRWQVLKRNHDDIGHFSVDKTFEKIRSLFWFPRMKRYIRRYIGSCLECLHNKKPAGKRPGELHSIDKGTQPFHTLHIDHLGPFVKSKLQNEHLIVMVDGFTKYTILRPVRNTRSPPVTRFLKEIVTIFGAPERVITDQGTAFTGSPFESYCKEAKIAHIKNATATPRANGQVERYNRTITPALASSCKDAEGRDWDEHVAMIQWGINNTIHKATKRTPFSLLFNYTPRGISGDDVEDEVRNDITADVMVRRTQAIEDLRRDQMKQQVRYNSRRAGTKTYQPGDLVFIERGPVATGQSLKLAPKYRGPYVVTKVLPNDTYRVEDLPEHQNTQRFYSNTVPVDKIKLWNVQEAESSSEEEHENIEEEDELPEETRQQPIRNRRKPKRYMD